MMRIAVLTLLSVTLATALGNPVGTSKCTYGPSYWCDTMDKATECGAVDYCVSKGLLKLDTTPAPAPAQKQNLGANPCTYGPSYWCDSEEKANQCNAMEYCVSKGLLTPSSTSTTAAPATAPKKLGANPCTWGPSYWCDTEDKATQCNAMEYCVSKGLLKPSATTTTAAPMKKVGTNPCTYGPSYFCDTQDKANECGTLDYCVSKGLLKPTPTPAPLGADECTFGPSFWCANEDNANKCNATEYCVSKGLLTTAAPLGADECTFGPSYWCANEDNANKCSATDFCVQHNMLAAPAAKKGKLHLFQAIHNALTAGDAADCDMCKLVVGSLNDKLANMTVQNEIIAKVETVCKDLGHFAPTCDAFMSVYGPEIINYLIGKLDPSTLCIEIKACPAPKQE